MTHFWPIIMDKCQSQLPRLTNKLFAWCFMLDAGCWMPDAPCLVLDAWCLILDAWCLTLDAWCLTLDAPCLMLDAWCLILVVSPCLMRDALFSFLMLDPGWESLWNYSLRGWLGNFKIDNTEVCLGRLTTKGRVWGSIVLRSCLPDVSEDNIGPELAGVTPYGFGPSKPID